MVHISKIFKLVCFSKDTFKFARNEHQVSCTEIKFVNKIFDPEERGNLLLQNMVSTCDTTSCHNPKDHNLNSHYCENLKIYNINNMFGNCVFLNEVHIFILISHYPGFSHIRYGCSLHSCIVVLYRGSVVHSK
jgi:hypothetical protein